MSLLVNPYKRILDPQQCRKVIADVGVDDWEYIYRRHPYRGLQDALFGSLFSRFVEIIKETPTPEIYDPTALERYADVISSLHSVRGHAVPRAD